MRAASVDSASEHLWHTEPVLPAQLSSRKLYMDVPELQLVAAILEDAIHCVARHAHTRDRRQARAYGDARDWLLDDGRDHCFAFHNVCELLSLDAGAVRTRVLALLDRQDRPPTASDRRCIHRDPPVARHTPPAARHDVPARRPRRRDVPRPPRREDSPQERFERLGWDEV